jgi:hypothetical protein
MRATDQPAQEPSPAGVSASNKANDTEYPRPNHDGLILSDFHEAAPKEHEATPNHKGNLTHYTQLQLLEPP